jgi:integrase
MCRLWKTQKGPHLKFKRDQSLQKGASTFVSERGAPLSAPGFSRMIERAAVVADLGIKAHAHMLRHACGYKLAMTGSTRGRCKLTWGIAISRIRRGTPRWRRIDSRVSGRTKEHTSTGERE